MGIVMSFFWEWRRRIEEAKRIARFTPVDQFEFIPPFKEESMDPDNNYLPEEVLIMILNNVPPKDLLNMTLVCKRWSNLIKSEYYWMNFYNKKHRSKAKQLPWYVFYCYFTTNSFSNMVKNGNGQDQLMHWETVEQQGYDCKVEDPPSGVEPLPTGLFDFNGHTSCFSTGPYGCVKKQVIILRDKRLLSYIRMRFNPLLYASEWVAGKFDTSVYKLMIIGYSNKYFTRSYHDRNNEAALKPYYVHQMTTDMMYLSADRRQWDKVAFIVKDYPLEVEVLVFENWVFDKTRNGSSENKMAGGMVKFVFESIDPSDYR